MIETFNVFFASVLLRLIDGDGTGVIAEDEEMDSAFDTLLEVELVKVFLSLLVSVKAAFMMSLVNWPSSLSDILSFALIASVSAYSSAPTDIFFYLSVFPASLTFNPAELHTATDHISSFLCSTIPHLDRSADAFQMPIDEALEQKVS